MGNAILRRSKRACALCNALNRHDYPDEPYDTYEGSCIYEGWIDYVCTRCNNLETIWTGYNTSNHEGPYEDTDINVATCVTPVITHRVCSACGDIIDIIEGDKDPSNHEAIGYSGDGSSSTCITHGDREVHCDACGEVWGEELPLDPSNHEGPIGESGDGQPSTCVTHGDKEVHCEACGEWWSEQLPLDPNNHENWIDGGLQVEGHCEACGALCDHEFYKDSEGYYRCSKCGYYDY